MFFLRENSCYDVEEINAVTSRNALSLVSRYEQLFTNELKNVASGIVRDGKRLVMLTGPSCSGKTTTSHKLSDELAALHIATVVVSLDDFYRNRSDIPKDANGKKDFETVDALDISLLTEKLVSLVSGKKTLMPSFDFIRGIRLDDVKELTLGNDHIAVIEGIHALSPKILGSLPAGSFASMYISAHSDFRSEDRICLTKTDVRLLRRSVRDNATRGSTAEDTLRFWSNVVRGEKLYIKPNMPLAGIKICTTFPYDPCVLKSLALPLLKAIPESSEAAPDAKRLISALELFNSVDTSLLPPDALLREFVGGSVYYG